MFCLMIRSRNQSLAAAWVKSSTPQLNSPKSTSSVPPSALRANNPNASASGNNVPSLHK